MGLKEAGLRGSLRNVSSVLPAFFDVTITNTNSPVQEGDILTVDYSANNTGDAQDTQDIRLEIDSVEEDRDADVTLGGGVSATGVLEWDTTGEAETTYTATVLSDDDTDSVTVEIGSAIPDSGMFQSPIYQFYAGEQDAQDNDSPVPYPEVLAGLSDATAVNAPTYRTGIGGYDGIEYDGAGDAHEWGPDSQIPSGADPFSWAALVRFDSLGDNCIAGYGTDTTDQINYFGTIGGEVAHSFWANTLTTGQSPATGQLVTVGVSYDGSNRSVYYNGTNIGNDTAGAVSVADVDHQIGRIPARYEFNFDGVIVEIIESNVEESSTAFSNYHNDRIA